MKAGAAALPAVEFARAALSDASRGLAVAARRVGEGGSDPVEPLHELRVAIRRVRTDLRVFEPIFDSTWLAGARAALRDLARQSGPTRDLDVIIGRLGPLTSNLPACDQLAAQALLTRLEQDRRVAFGRVVDVLTDGGATVEALAATLTNAPLAAHANQAVLDDLVAATRKQWRRLRSAADAAEEEPTDDALHRVRLRVKTLRYSLETLAPVLQGSARKHAKALAVLQDHLGEIHDTVVIERWLRVHGPSQDGGFVMGELLGLERARGDELRRTWPTAWARASRKRLRRWAR